MRLYHVPPSRSTRNGEILSRSATFEHAATARRSLSSLTKALTGAEIIDVTRPVELTSGLEGCSDEDGEGTGAQSGRD
jgi:hypothetical protein